MVKQRTRIPLSYYEELPPALERQLSRHIRAGEPVYLKVAADLGRNLSFGKRWVVVTNQRVLLLSGETSQEPQSIGLGDIKAVETGALIGGGFMSIRRRDAPPLTIYYTASESDRFATLAAAIRRLAAGQRLLFDVDQDPSHCLKCGRPLAGRSGRCPACSSRRETVARLLRRLTPYRRQVLLLLPLMILAAAAALVPPLVTARIIDGLLAPTADEQQLLRLVALLVLVAAAGWAAELGQQWLSIWIGNELTASLRDELYRHLQRLPVRFFDRWPTGTLLARILNDANHLQTFLVESIPLFTIHALTVLGITVLLFYLDWRLALLALLPILPILLWTAHLRPLLARDFGRQSARWSRLFANVHEAVANIRIMKAFGQEERHKSEFDVLNESLFSIQVRRERRWFSYYNFTHFALALGATAIWFAGGRQVLDGRLTVGELMAFVTYVWLLYWPLQRFWLIQDSFSQAAVATGRMMDVLDERDEPYDDQRLAAAPAVGGHIAFQDVCFGYTRGDPVLQNIHLAAAPGEIVGIVGRSGAGKTTLFHLLCRYYDVTSGAITVDGQDIRGLRLTDLRRHIGIVPQEASLTRGTIAENIAFSDPAATFDDVLRAARAAGAHEFIIARPDGYDTLVGELGQHLSGGERQRLAIARALLGNPRILLFDEATSSLDRESEREIQRAFERLARERTVLIIAHRLSTVKGADRLYVVDEGRIVESGSYAALMARRGALHQMVRRSQGARAFAAPGRQALAA